MNLKPKAVAVWLAAPLMAMMVVACGDDGETTTPPLDGGPGSGEEDGECGNDIVEGDEECDDKDEPLCAACHLIDANCGNGTKEGDEECDNGRANGSAGGDCTLLCLSNKCGDGYVGGDEECDEKSSACVECKENVCGDGVKGPEEACDDGEATETCTAACTSPDCGDKEVQDGEECDDGNNDNTDACTNICKNPKCGDSIIQGEEECDDGNKTQTDSCTNACKSPACGDSYVQAGEVCDLGADNADDGECTTKCSLPDCGDGVKGELEECDDKNNVEDDECTNVCTAPRCGDGIKNGDDECDDGNQSNTDSCTNDCTVAACGDGYIQASNNETCDGDVVGDDCTDTCGDSTCGNGITDGADECDDGNQVNNDECTNNCTTISCGDGIVQDGEDCDDGNDDNDDACLATCVDASCGDGFVGPGESCDDENTEDDEECLSDCSLPGCGDGQVVAPEACDDGNSVDTDECTNACTVSECGDGIQSGAEECDNGSDNSDTTVDACRVECLDASCGDGVKDTGEECDNGENNGAGKPCTASCRLNTCGDGIVQGEEECDDDNDLNSDSCLNTCQWNSCGDGAVYAFLSNGANPNAVEQCDDGNDVESDRCLATCKYNVCGDTVKLVDLTSEPYADPDGLGPKTASRNLAAVLPLLVPFPGAVGGAPIGCGASPLPACNDTFLAAEGALPVWDFDAATTGDALFGALKAEECDDGIASNNDSCRRVQITGATGLFQCVWNECGDGDEYTTVTDATNPNAVEECDDANKSNTDSCIDSCVWNDCHDGYRYVDATDSSHPLYAATGRGVEACDDGNTLNNDACVDTCKVADCGDNHVYAGHEQCDDGTAIVGAADNCDATPDNAATVPDESGTCLFANNSCGNGIVDPGEECDDGNGDAVPVTDTADGLYNGDNNSCTSACTKARCGDALSYTTTTNNALGVALEACDDGNANNRDDCLNTCVVEKCGDGFQHEYKGNPAGSCEYNESAPGCTPGGAAGEQCDLGAANGGALCSALCKVPTCGDKIVQNNETCDDGGNNGEPGSACTDTCTAQVCGDGQRGPDELCDLGAANGTTGAACTTNCTVPSCGNGQADDGALTCDDGNSDNTDDCTNRCIPWRCGDGIISAVNGEDCDDANDENKDSCTNACLYNSCGDGIRYTAVTDERNPAALHNCDSASAQVEDLDAVDPDNDGDGVCEENETCTIPDDGFVDSSDFCSATCQMRCPSIDDPTSSGIDHISNTAALLGGACVFVAQDRELGHREAGLPADDFDPVYYKNSWLSAKNYCAGYGWSTELVVIGTTANPAITQAAVGTLLAAADLDDDTNGEGAWIGLRDTSAETVPPLVDGPGAWFWENGTGGGISTAGALWATGQPSQLAPGLVGGESTNQDCGQIAFANEGVGQLWQYYDAASDCGADDPTPVVAGTIGAVCMMPCAAEGDCQ